MIIVDQSERGILLVDDDPAVRDALKKSLEQKGFRKIFLAEDGMQAITCLELNGDDIYVIVSDVVMPKMDGVKLAEFLTTNYHVPTGIIYITGYSDKMDEFEITTFTDGDIMKFDLMMKPLNITHLADRVKQCGDVVFNRRIGELKTSVQSMYKVFEDINSQTRADVGNISNELSAIKREVQAVKNQIPSKSQLSEIRAQISHSRKRNILEDLGFEVIKAIVIAVLLIVLVKGFGWADLI